MLGVAGGSNVLDDARAQSVQVSTEQILSRRPDVILEVRAANSAFPMGEQQQELDAWKRLAAVPAVRAGRVHFLFDDRIVIPGPRVVDGISLMARTLHPELFR